jgi:Ca2+-binding EF-hand superfamily protein
MLEFDALRYPHGHHAATKKGSWFSAAHTQEVYAIYLGLDANQNGMLSREEFRQYNGGNLTTIFIDGLFSEYRMYPSAGDDAAQQGGGTSSPSSSGVNGSLAAAATQPAELEMDYKTFLDFVLAMEYKQSPASLAYFFRILDLKAVGYLDAATIRYWFRAVAEKMASLGHEPVSAAVVASEIFDMVCPAVEGRITLQDLVASKCGHTVVSILIDVNGFWKYDNRENLMHTENADNDE